MKPEKQKLSLIPFFLIGFLVLAHSYCRPGAESQEIQNLRALAKLYGYVRYFHPSDEASRIDWDRFVIHGATRVKNAPNNQELKSVLEDLFYPIAPTIHLYHSGEEPIEPKLNLPEVTTGLKVVAWQHRGIGFGAMNSTYVSVRLNREIILKAGLMGVLTQGIDAKKLRKREIKLRASVKVQGDDSDTQGFLWLRVDRENGQMGFFDNMMDRPIRSDEWAVYEINGKVDDDALMVYFGGIISGVGELWLDDFELLVQNDDGVWEPLEIKNPGFEEGEVGRVPTDWSAPSPGIMYKIQKHNKTDGGQYLLMETRTRKISGPIFDKHPDVGEIVNKKLGSNLYCQIPLALYSDKEGTLGENGNYPFEKLLQELEDQDFGKLTADDEYVRLADVIIAWNVFQHFYPYFDVVDVDWDKELTKALRSALEDETETDFFYTLSRMVANLQDGHGNVYHQVWTRQAGLPIKVDWVENQVVIIVSKDPSHFKRGDIILEIDGIGTERALLNAEEFISGSSQWKRWKALSRFGYGEPGTMAKLKLKRGQQVLEVEHERNFKQYLTEFMRSNIEGLDDDIYYINLSKASWAEINARIQDLAVAKGIIFDLRGYPNSNHQIICHLLEKNDTSDAWMQIPFIIYPDQENIVDYQKMGWGLVARDPHIQGKVVFLTDGRAISYAESFMSFIEHYRLGEIVGQPTAGTNGNVNPFILPGGFRIIWTGMKVLKHDGSQHHLIGIQPTFPVERTIQGVIEGRDEFLEKALEIVKQ